MTRCQHCEGTFANRSSLKRHISAKHPSETDNHGETRTRHQCPRCHAYFARRETVRRHVRSKHKGDLSTCSFCSKQFRADYIPQHRATCARKYWQKIEQHANPSDNADVTQNDNLQFRNEQLSEAQDQNHTLRIVYENTFDTNLAADAFTQALERFRKTENVESYKAALVTALRLKISISNVERTHDRYFRFYQLRLVATYFDEIVRGVRQVNDLDNCFGTKILHAACLAGFAELLEPLFWRGACFDSFDQFGRTALDLAIDSDDIDTVRYALALGSDPNQNFPLFFAFTAGRHDITTLLLKHGADINQSIGDATVLSTAIEDSNLDDVRFALSLGADPNVAHPIDNLVATCLDEDCHDCVHEEMACLLIEHGADISRKYWKGCTILHYAAVKAYSQLLSLALHRISSSMTLDVEEDSNNTSLHYAVQACHMVPLHQVLMTTSMLLEAGADVNVQNVFGRSALMLAAREGNDELVRLLLDAGANVKDQCHDGQTALSYAAECGHGTTVGLLLEKAPPTLENSAHLSFALEKAVEGDHRDVVEQLHTIVWG